MITPRDYQLDVVSRARARIAAGVRRLVIQGATGSGKTTVSSMICRSAVEKQKQVLFIAHRRRLIEQKAKRLEEFGVPHGIIMQGERRSNAPVQVASRDTLLSRTIRNDWMRFPNADIVIVDECHNCISEQYQSLLDHYPHAIIIGLTATPARSDGRGLGSFFQDIVCTVPTSRLIADEWLVPVRCYAPHKSGKDCKRELSGDPVYHWKKYGENRPTVLFTTKVNYSLAACAAFNAAGIPAAHIDAHTPDAERNAVIDGLNTGKIKIVSNVGVWTEGVDVPCLSCCILLRLASSYVLFAQCIGRIMRKHPGKTDAILIDHSGAVFEHGFPDEDVEWTLSEDESIDERVKKDKEAGKRKEPVCCPRCAMLFSGSMQCPACGYLLMKKPKDAPKVDALLFEVPREQKEAADRETKERFWKRCLAIAANRGQSFAVASGMYKRKYPEGPSREFRHYPQGNEWRRGVAEVFPQFVRQGA